MEKVVKLKDIDIQEGGFIAVCYADGHSELGVFEVNPTGKKYQSSTTAKRAILARIRNQYGREVEISEELQSAIEDLADTLGSQADEEEKEAMWASHQMRGIEEADALRERWLYQRK